MATKKPKNKEEMLKITGVGEYKLKKYGDLFLKEIGKHCKAAQEKDIFKERSSCRSREFDGTQQPDTDITDQSALTSKPHLKKETVLRAMETLEDEFITMINVKLGGGNSDDQIRTIYHSIIKK